MAYLCMLKFRHQFAAAGFLRFEKKDLTLSDYKEARTEIAIVNTRNGKGIRFCELTPEKTILAVWDILWH